MRTRHYWLLVLFTLFTLCYVFGIWLNADWLAGFSSNLAAGFLGAFLIVFLIDRSLAKEREAETKRIQNIAFKQLRPILLRHLGLLIDWYRASVPEKPKSLPQSFQEIFGEDYFYQIGFLDFLKTSGTFPPLNWMQYSSHQLTSLNTETYRVLDKYAVYMDATFLELVENVLDSDLVSMLIQLCNVDIQSFDKAHGIVRKYTFLYGESDIT